MSFSIRPLDDAHVDIWIDVNLAARGAEELRRLSQFWHEAKAGERDILVAWQDAEFLGHITLLWESEYSGFRKYGFSEIVDLWVQENARRQGVGFALLRAAEDLARNKEKSGLGLGVGTNEAALPARQLYMREGYQQDGSGEWLQVFGETVTMWWKNL